ncbi:MAG TPA: threonine--tRNA ligase [Actinobacteria bacterium]|nr:threonine--tRNA ligase [Actinomycetota bacterium]
MFDIYFENIGTAQSSGTETIYELLACLDKPSAKKAVIVKINADDSAKPCFADLNFVPEKSLKVSVLFQDDEKSIETLNHSTSHIMASAISKIYPEAKFAIGPSIKDGFYYDFDIDENISLNDLKNIENEMKKIISSNTVFQKEIISKKQALEMFSDNSYKTEIINELEDENISIYRTGDFVDLCSGPHITNTSKVTAFKLLSVAGAYWRGSEENKMLVRIYGAAFFSKEDLKKYLDRLERAKLSDHRKIGRDLDLFSFHDEAPGFPFWHPKGAILINTVTDYWREVHIKSGYREIRTPIILNNELWKTSGHWDHYKDNMYFINIEDSDYAVKPMNCPGAILVYKTHQHSYKEFPLRYAELGLVHRHEKSGVLHGLFRVRNFTQDDAHIFTTGEYLGSEITNVIKMINDIYEVFGFKDYHLELSTRPDDRIGTDEMWDEAELQLEKAMKKNGLDYKINPGDGAFYGPKIDFHIKDALDRTWQCATIQLDFAMPELFDLYYMGEDNQKHRPIMLHRVVLGSLERFIGILIENYSGNLPLWLAPVQVMILPISDKVSEYAGDIFNSLREEGLRVEIDSRIESLDKKIRNAELSKIPAMIIIGEKEKEAGTVSLRKKSGGDIRDIRLEELICMISENIAERKTSF